MVEYQIRLKLINEMSVLIISNCVLVNSYIDYAYSGISLFHLLISYSVIIYKIDI